MLYDVLVQVYTLYQGQDSVCTYYTKPTKLWSTYDTNKENTDPPNQFERSAKFLMGLNESYTTIRGVLMAQKPTPKHGELCPIIKQEEQQRSHSALHWWLKTKVYTDPLSRKLERDHFAHTAKGQGMYLRTVIKFMVTQKNLTTITMVTLNTKEGPADPTIRTAIT